MSLIFKQKKRLRDELKTTLAAISETRRRGHNERIHARLLELAQIKHANVVFCFLSHGTEVDTHNLVRTLSQQGKQIAVPKIINSEKMIAVAFTSAEELVPGQLGILTPVSSEPIQATIDVCITPGLGFSTTGARLGFGRGYYDQWFRENTVDARIAMAYECQIQEHIPVDGSDIAVEMIVTEQRTLPCTGLEPGHPVD